MELYTRLIDSGVFIFWAEDDENSTFKLNISIVVNDKKIKLLDFSPSRGQYYYSFGPVGAGKYEIELNGYRNGKIYQTATKKIEIVSSAQKAEELKTCINDGFSNANSYLMSISWDISTIKDAYTDPKTRANLEKEVDARKYR